MKRFFLRAGVVAAVAFAARAEAGVIDVGAVLSAPRPDGANFDYTITLTNLAASTDPIETFWFSWVPGKDFMPVSPTSVAPPTGWADIVTNGGASDGFAIQFKTSTNPLLPGQSLAFTFTSAATLAQLEGTSPFYPGTPVLTAFVYQGQPFQGDSAQFLVSAVPEPSSLALAALGTAAAAGWGLARRRALRRGLLAESA